jgi:hypothetical protein
MYCRFLDIEYFQTKQQALYSYVRWNQSIMAPKKISSSTDNKLGGQY